MKKIKTILTKYAASLLTFGFHLLFLKQYLSDGTVTIHAHHNAFTQNEQQSKLMVFGTLGLAIFLAIYSHLLSKKLKAQPENGESTR